jgi:hypothetical protein
MRVHAGPLDDDACLFNVDVRSEVVMWDFAFSDD